MIFKLFNLCLIPIVFFTSCGRIQLDKFVEKNSIISNEYDAYINSFLISEDKKKFVVISKKHHYIFSLDDKLRNILEWKNRKTIKPEFSLFNVDLNNNVIGEYNLYYNLINDAKTEETLIKYGFEKTNKYTSMKGVYYKYSGKITGIRYLAKEPIPIKYKFEKVYRIHVKEKLNSLEKTTNIAMTPVMFTGNAIVMVTAAGTFIVLVIPIYFIIGRRR